MVLVVVIGGVARERRAHQILRWWMQTTKQKVMNATLQYRCMSFVRTVDAIVRTGHCRVTKPRDHKVAASNQRGSESFAQRVYHRKILGLPRGRVNLSCERPGALRVQRKGGLRLEKVILHNVGVERERTTG